MNTMTRFATWAKSVETLELADLVAIRLQRNLQHKFIHRWHGGRPEANYAQGREDYARQLVHCTHNGYKLVRIEREGWLYFQFVTNDGREWPMFVIAMSAVPDLFAGKLVELDLEGRGDIEWAIARWRYGALTISLLGDPARSEAIFKRVNIAIPPDVLRQAFKRALDASWPKSYRYTKTFFRITARHHAFWSPNARIEWSGKALDVYNVRKNFPAGGGLTLHDLVQDKLQIARNYSKSQKDAYAVRFYAEDQLNLGWGIYREADNRCVFNGGLIWHGDHYSSHT